jgi:AcrR family transcriptional regulator
MMTAMQDRSRRTRAALIRATTELVAEAGYHGATTKAIAERAGVSEGAIYRHFPDKKALFAAAVLAGQRDVTDWMQQLPARAGTAPLAGLIVETLTQLSRLREAVLPLEEASPRVLRPPHDLTRDELVAALRDNGGPPLLLAEFLGAEQRLGRVSPTLEPERSAVMILAAFLGVQTSPLAGTDGLDHEDIRAFAELICHGLAAGAAGAGEPGVPAGK